MYALLRLFLSQNSMLIEAAADELCNLRPNVIRGNLLFMLREPTNERNREMKKAAARVLGNLEIGNGRFRQSALRQLLKCLLNEDIELRQRAARAISTLQPDGTLLWDNIRAVWQTVELGVKSRAFHSLSFEIPYFRGFAQG